MEFRDEVCSRDVNAVLLEVFRYQVDSPHVKAIMPEASGQGAVACANIEKWATAFRPQEVDNSIVYPLV
jgi:hypothetical protein